MRAIKERHRAAYVICNITHLMHSVKLCVVLIRMARGCEPRAEKSKHNKLKKMIISAKMI